MLLLIWNKLHFLSRIFLSNFHIFSENFFHSQFSFCSRKLFRNFRSLTFPSLRSFPRFGSKSFYNFLELAVFRSASMFMQRRKNEEYLRKNYNKSIDEHDEPIMCLAGPADSIYFWMPTFKHFLFRAPKIFMIWGNIFSGKV